MGHDFRIMKGLALRNLVAQDGTNSALAEVEREKSEYDPADFGPYFSSLHFSTT
jgi:hypothetical protein